MMQILETEFNGPHIPSTVSIFVVNVFLLVENAEINFGIHVKLKSKSDEIFY